jgi:hypothetical protein
MTMERPEDDETRGPRMMTEAGGGDDGASRDDGGET